jgi:D-alanyl-D-alanine carboxypeptidase
VQTDDSVIGGKTGYTQLAKRTLVTAFEKDGMRLIVVTFIGSNDFNIHKNLSKYGYENYRMIKVLNSGIIDIFQYPITPIIYRDIKYPVHTDEELECQIHMLNNPKEALIGKIYLYINKKVVSTTNVYRYY